MRAKRQKATWERWPSLFSVCWGCSGYGLFFLVWGCGEVLDCLVHVVFETFVEFFPVACFEEVEDVLVFLDQGVCLGVGDFQVQDAHC